MDVSIDEAAADVPALLAGGLADPTRPLLTYYDDATGERTELSAEELGGWAARTASLLVEECGLGSGSRAAVLLPPHWQTAAVLLGAWSASVSVAFHSTATAGLPRLGPNADAAMDVTFVARNRLDNWLEDVPEASHQFVLGLAPHGAPLAEVPAGYRDFLPAVRAYDESRPPRILIGRTEAASVDGTSYRQWGSLAQDMATRFDIQRGDRVLIDAAEHEHPLKWLLIPLAAGASVVLCANLDPAVVEARVRSERVTRVL